MIFDASVTVAVLECINSIFFKYNFSNTMSDDKGK